MEIGIKYVTVVVQNKIQENIMKELNTVQEYEDVISSEGVNLIDIYADWCGPCKGMMPILESLEEKYEGKIAIYKLNADGADLQSVIGRLGVRSIPTLFFVKNGEIVETKIGAQPSNELEEVISKLI